MTTETQPLRGPLRKRESHLWERDEHDWYVEPEWCSQRLFEREIFLGDVTDPACGMGRIVLAAREVGLAAGGMDLIDRGYGYLQGDFMQLETVLFDNIVSNPPFSIAEEFARKALRQTKRKVALLLPANWVQGDRRSRWLAQTPLLRVYFITPRPSMPPGRVIEAGVKPGNGTTDYCWMVWEHGYFGPPRIDWIRREA